MRKGKRLISLLLAISIVFTLLPINVFGADQKSTDAGVRIVESEYDSAKKILTVGVQVKLPKDSMGLTSAGSIVSYDSSKLTLMHRTNDTLYTPTTTLQSINAVANVVLKDADETNYISANVDLYGSSGRAALFVGIIPAGNPDETKNTTEWFDMYKLRFKVSGDAATVLDKDSIRIADPTKDAAIIKGSFPANNDYVVSVFDNTDTTKIYKFGKMADNKNGELKGTEFLMAAEGHNTATYTGSTNGLPKTNPVAKAPTGVKAVYGQKLSEIKLTNPTGNTEGTWTWVNGDTSVGDASSTPKTFKAKFTPTKTNSFNVVENVDVSVTVGAKSLTDVSVDPIGAKEFTNSKITPDVVVKGDGGKTLALDKDYTVTYGENKTVGDNKGTVTIKAKAGGNYTFSDVTAKFNITRAAGSTITISGNLSKKYDGNTAVEPTVNKSSTGEVTFKYYTNENCTTETTTASGAAKNGGSPKNVGDYWVKATLGEDNNYSGATSQALKFTISPADYTITVTDKETVKKGTSYPTSSDLEGTGVNGEKVSGTIEWFTDSNRTVKATGSFSKAEGTTLYWKYTLKNTVKNYGTEVKTGSRVYTVSELPQHTITTESTVTIGYGSKDAKITATCTTGKVVYTVTSGGDVIGINETTGAITVKKIGTATVTAKVLGNDNYSEASKSITVNVERGAATVTIDPIANVTYNGKAHTPQITVKNNGQVVAPSNYNVAYTNNTNAGTATVTVTEKTGGNYKFGEKVATFVIDKAESTTKIAEAIEVVTNTEKNGVEVDLTGKLNGIEGAKITKVTKANDQSNLVSNATINGNKVVLNIGKVAEANKTATVNATIESTNYKDIVAVITVKTVKPAGKEAGVVTLKSVPQEKTYGDKEFSISAEIDKAGEGKGVWTWTSSDSSVLKVEGNGDKATVKVLKASVVGVTITAKYESDTVKAEATSEAIKVKKADITIKAIDKTINTNATVPSLTSPTKDTNYKVDGLIGEDKLGGKVTMAYQKNGSNVTPDNKSAGTYDIVITGVESPNEDNYNPITIVKGILTIKKASTTSSDNTSTTNNEGTTNKNTTTKTETQTTTLPDGGTKTVEKKTDGTVTTIEKDTKGNEIKEVKDPDGTTKTTEKKSDGTIIDTETTTSGKTTAEVTVKDTQKETKVSVPVELGNKDGKITAKVTNKKTNVSEEVEAKYSDGNVTLTIKENSTIEIMDDFVPLATVVPFKDIKTNAWYYDNIEYIYSNNLMMGITDTKFGPNDTTTRAMIVTILYRMEGSPTTTNTGKFKDVKAGSWYGDAVAWAEENGIVSGYGNGKYGPNDKITREQMASIIYRYNKYSGGDTSVNGDLSKYADNGEISKYAKDAVSWANNEGLLSGVSAKSIAPKGAATRAQIASILARYLEKNGK